jgi:hypothetical protein
MLRAVSCCEPKRHLLAVVTSTEHGKLVMWRSDSHTWPWEVQWHDEISNPAELDAWCECDRVWTLDVSNADAPRLR